MENVENENWLQTTNSSSNLNINPLKQLEVLGILVMKRFEPYVPKYCIDTLSFCNCIERKLHFNYANS